MKSERIKLLDERGLRNDGRRARDLRPIKIEVGLLKNADGSAYLEQGKNKVIVAVYGPREVHKGKSASMIWQLACQMKKKREYQSKHSQKTT